ncbi:hypothetical protein [Radicibacter daui]|uniref:hypothetical protein n=1 Tax=Radicibacter daui TaxID=3064829 RepID=UPI004046BC0A
MAFRQQDMGVLAYSNGFTLWHYRSDDTAATVAAAGYFNAAAASLRAGDMVLASTAQSSSPAAKLIGIVSVASGAVTVAAA